MYFVAPIVNWGAGIPTATAMVSPAAAWSLVIALLVVSCVAVWLQREVGSTAEAKEQAPTYRNAA